MRETSLLGSQYRNAARDLIAWGHRVAPRDVPTYEQLGCTIYANSGSAVHRKGFNEDLARVEMLSILAGGTHRKALQSVVKPDVYSAFFKDRNVEYAEHLGDSLWRMLDTLTADPCSRQAIAFVANNELQASELPCTLSYQLMVRGEGLQGFVNMRSWDLYRGVPYDIYMWSGISTVMQVMLSERIRPLPHQTTSFYTSSLHLYDEDEEAVKNCEPQSFFIDLDYLDVSSVESAKASALAKLEEIVL